MKKDRETVSKVEDSLFYYETKEEYLFSEISKIKSKSYETLKAVKSSLVSYHQFLTTKKGKAAETICFDDYKYKNLREFRNWATEECHYANSTINQRISLIRGFLKFASNVDDSIMAIYLKAKRIENLSVPDHPIEYYTEDEIAALLDSPDRTRKIGRRNSVILSLEYNAALRIGEIPRITLGDLRIRDKNPHLLVCGKGNTYLPVPLTDIMVKRINEYLNEFHPDGKATNPLFYQMYNSEKGISIDTIEGIIKSSVEKCKLCDIQMPENNHSHMFRKSRAMHLYERGVSLAHIQQLLRHRHIDTTRGFYAFATLATLRNSIEGADKMREEGREKKWLDPETRKKLNEFSK